MKIEGNNLDNVQIFNILGQKVEEFEMQGIRDICKFVNSYEDFSSYLNGILNDYQIPYNMEYEQFISRHTVCNWYKDLVIKLEKYAQ